MCFTETDEEDYHGRNPSHVAGGSSGH